MPSKSQEFKLISKTCDGDEIFISHDTIFVQFAKKRNGIVSSWLNGGYSEDLRGVFNHQLTQENIDRLGEGGILDYLIDLSGNYSNVFDFKTETNDSIKLSGLVTSADIKKYAIACEKFKGLEVWAITTAGVRVNAASAGDRASFYEIDGNYETIETDFKNKFGTINTILLINARLDKDSLLLAEMTAVEAKTVALRDLMVASNYSEEIATGTGTDGIAIFSNLESENLCENATKHSKLGEMIAKVVIDSIKESLAKIQWMTPTYQLNALIRLDRFDLDLDCFYNDFLALNAEDEKKEFIKSLVEISHNPELVAYVSLLIHIADQYRVGLLSKKTAEKTSEALLESHFQREDWNSMKLLLKFFLNENLK
ncbi:adenosylcobinamide amidohydrolase [uncultured Methanobrevibacter sp.]|uniref:adenosylcobinamide amidohydrolase n=1 Tax=uncultured Methanobrevibacter sp. TaxID=253161 RepID=UPI002636A7C0